MAHNRRNALSFTLAAMLLISAWVASTAAARTTSVSLTTTREGTTQATRFATVEGPATGSLVLLGSGLAIAAQVLKRRKPRNMED